MYAAFMNLKKAYNRVDSEALGSVLRVCRVGQRVLEGIKDLLLRSKCVCESKRRGEWECKRAVWCPHGHLHEENENQSGKLRCIGCD